MFDSLIQTLSKVAGTAAMQLKDRAPEILTATGIVGVVASGVLASKATLKLDQVIDEAQGDLAKRDKTRDEFPVAYSHEDFQRDTIVIYGRAVVGVVKLYLPAILIGAASIACLIGSNRIMRSRNMALAAAYKALDTSFRRYRARVIEDHGKETDRDYVRGVRDKRLVDENGKDTGETVRVIDPDEASTYARLYDETLLTWQRTHDARMQFLKHTEAMMNQRLQRKGFITLNEVYDALGLEWTQAGQEVGWVHDTNHGDGYIDFGLNADRSPEVRDFIIGANDAVWLDFNVDGPIKYLFNEFRTVRESHAIEERS